MRTDYHNHLEKGTLTLGYLEKFLNEAKRKNIDEFGISEHAYHFYQTKDILSNDWIEERRYYDMNDYVDLFHQAWDKGHKLKMSIEMDYTPDKHEQMENFINAYPFDYVIGSVHWVGEFGIDLAEYRKEWERRDIKDVYTKYYDQIVTLAESNLFHIVGHLDLVKIFGFIPQDKTFLVEQYERATDALANSKTCVEISTAGLRKPIGEIYPETTLLEMCFKKDIQIVLSSDAHEPEHVGYEYEKAIALAQRVGYKSVATFSKGIMKLEPLT